MVYDGIGYDPAMVATLPWLDGIGLKRQESGFVPIEGMDIGVSEPAGPGAQLEDPSRLYRTWQVVSLAHLQSDGEIEVRTRDGLKVIFGSGPSAPENFSVQLAKLDLILDTVAKTPAGQNVAGEINLSLGSQVPVRLVAASPPAPVATAPALARPLPAFPQFKLNLN